MDDLSARLSEILNDPESMKQIGALAEGLLSERETSPPPAPLPGAELFEGLDLAKLTTLLSKYRSAENDPRVSLLLALKPNLSAERQKKVDTAVKLLKMLELLPLLKDSGLLNL